MSDRFGVPAFAFGEDPFVACLRSAVEQKSDALAEIRVHDDLYFARCIAVSVYGSQWEPHVMAIYDRLLSERRSK